MKFKFCGKLNKTVYNGGHTMKKLIGFIICIFIVFNICGCRKSKINEQEVLKKFNIEEASKTVDTYMKASMKNDVREMDMLYSNEFSKKTQEKNPNNIIITGYSFDEVSQSGEMGIIKVKVTKTNKDTPYAQLETDTFKIIKEKGSYKIKDLDSVNEKEVFIKGSQIRIRIKDKAKTLLVTNFQGMPKYYYTREDQAKSNMLPVSLDTYGNMALTYGGTAQAIATKGKNSFIEIVHYEEAMMTQAGGKSDQGSEQNAAANPNEPVEVAPEKPVAKEIVSIDIIENGTIDNMVFSEDEKLLAVQYTKNNIGTSIKVYRQKNGEVIPFKFDKNYPMGKLDVKIESFGKDGLIYNVTVKEKFKDDKSIKNMIGKWKLDTKKYKISKAAE